MKHYLNVIFLILTVVLSAFLEMPWVGVIGILVFLIILAFGVTTPKWNYFTNGWNSLANKKLLLTFDDGPHPEFTVQIVNELNKHDIKAVFFIIGEKADRHTEIVEFILESGHEIGCHSYHHETKFSYTAKSYLNKEIEWFQQFKNSSPQYFRSPFGVLNPNIARAIKRYNMQQIGWDFRSFDTKCHSKKDLLTRINHIQQNKHSVVLLHDNLKLTADCLPEIIESISKKGMQFVSRNEKIAWQK